MTPVGRNKERKRISLGGGLRESGYGCKHSESQDVKAVFTPLAKKDGFSNALHISDLRHAAFSLLPAFGAFSRQK